MICMRKHNTISEEVGGEEGETLTFVANYSKFGHNVAIFVPKQYHETVKALRNPLKVTVSEAVLK